MTTVNKIEVSNNAALAACEQVLTIWRTAEDAEAKIGNAKVRSLVAWLESTPHDLIIAGTDREKCGVPLKTAAASALSDARAFYRVFREAPEALEEIVNTGRGFRASLLDVRAIVKDLKAEAAIERETKAAAKVLSVQHRKDPEKAAAEIAAFGERLREHKAAEKIEREQQRAADAADPVKVAERIARRLIDAHDADFARAVAAAMDSAIDAVIKETAQERATAEA